ncbi:MAG: dTDP-4-dehydrorhamnose 3,5-epimerase [Chlamydiota bacterium]|nr:dTDP-4-dehydrorhamnose 3,5-epimerase [Chlamydiota bacterium]
MNIYATAIDDIKIIEPTVFSDERGYFFESYNKKEFNKLIGRDLDFVQDNHSKSVKNTLRGLHYQTKNVQAKLVRVLQGEIFDVAVDLRKESPSYGKWVSATLSCVNKRMLWIPEGFAHGFLVLSDNAEVLYKASNFYHPEAERSIIWSDPDLAIKWPIDGSPILSDKDSKGILFKKS